MKPGYKTTEFWLALLAQLLPLLVLTGILSPDEVSAIETSTLEVVKVVGSLIVAVIPLWRYIDSRAKIKSSK